MIVLKKEVKVSSLLVTGIIIIIIGINLIILNSTLYKFVIEILSLAIVLNGLASLLKIIGKKIKGKETKISVGMSIVNIFIGLIMVQFEKIPLSILPILTAFYMLLNATIKIINIAIMKKNKVTGITIELISFIFLFIFGITLLFSPFMYLDTVLKIIGIYFIAYGISDIADCIRIITPNKTKNKLKRRIRISLPVALVTFIPHNALKKINKAFSVSVKTKKISKISEKVCNEKPDIEVFIHVSDNGSGVIGHCDLCFDDKIISYGNYDSKSFKLFDSIGDGILFKTNKKKYIKLCITHSKKTLFVFGIKLTEEQKKSVKQRIKEIDNNLYPWKSAYEEDLEKNKNISFSNYSDYPSILYHDTSAKLYKFKKGKFKTYFIFSTNCVLLADSILGASGTDIVKINGIITPGTYYDYLDNMYRQPNTNVISKDIYR